MRYLLILLAVLILAVPAIGEKFTAEDIAYIERAKVGDTIGIMEPAGDGCNTCRVFYLKVSDTEVRLTGYGLCTLLACIKLYPPIKFREEMAK